SRGAAPVALVRALRADVRYRRNQQQLLPAARARDVHRLGPPCAAEVRVRRQGQPLPDAHEKAEGSRGADRPALHAHARPRHASRAGTISTAAGMAVDRERFGHFLAALPRGARHVVEFREPSWYDAEIRRLMERFRVSLCLHDMPGSATGRDDEGRTGAFVYVRFHGATSKYGGGYPETRLRGWADWLNARRGECCDVYAYFNNDVGGHAPRDALTLRRALEES